jgi:hypothetical protein
VTPATVHRYRIPVAEAIRALVDAGDCEACELRLEVGEIVIDVVGPTTKPAQNIPEIMQEPAEKVRVENPDDPEQYVIVEIVEREEDEGGDLPSQEPPPPEKPKGGPIAAKAGMLCGERGFWTFCDAANANEAADWLRLECQVASRAELDHDETAAAKFRDIESRYRLWVDGYDV